MKKMLMAVLACAMMALVGCGVNQKDPESVAKAFAKAMLAGDAKTAVKLCYTPDKMKKISEKEMETLEKLVKKAAAESKVENRKLKSVTLKEKDGNSAKVDIVVESDEGLEPETVRLHNVEGKWYIQGMF